MADKRNRFLCLPVVIVVLIGTFTQITIAGAATPLEGAWLLTSTEDPDGNVDSEPLSGLVIFTSTHYSIMYTTGDKPRALMDQNDPSDKQTLEAYRTITANSGRYEVDGNKLTTRAYVTKHPNYMGNWPDNDVTFSFSIDGGTLAITSEIGASAGSKRIYRKVEGTRHPWE